MNGTNIKSFLDAKSLDVNIFTSKEMAFQIRSYGWSAQSPCAFVSNFEQFVIYDTRFVPAPDQKANIGTKQLSVIFFDGIVFNSRKDNKIVSKCVYSVLGINMEGQKEILDTWRAKI